MGIGALVSDDLVDVGALGTFLARDGVAVPVLLGIAGFVDEEALAIEDPDVVVANVVHLDIEMVVVVFFGGEGIGSSGRN